MTKSEIDQRMENLADGWQHVEAENRLKRDFKFKGFAKPAQLVNLCVWLSEEQDHHPDICFGWGYVKISLTSHDRGAVTDRDFRWAESLDQLLAAVATA